MSRFALGLLAVSLAVRLVLGWWLPLGTDEAYAIAVAREFSWSFFDHPPLGFWLPVAMAKLTGVEAAFVYRLPFILCGTVTGWAVWQMGRRLGGARAGDAALLLFALAPYFTIGAGLFVVPDGPLDMFLALAALALMRVVAQERPPLTGWLTVGLWLALAMACKYQAGLFPVSALGFLLLTRGQWRRMLTPGPWLAAGVGLAGLLPVVIWNLQHDWASFGFHTARVGPEFRPDTFARMLAGQFLYLLPPTAVIATLALFGAARRGAGVQRRLLGWLAALPVGMFMYTYLWGTNTFPHWTMPGWLFAMPLAGDWLAARAPARGWWRTLAGFAVAVWAVLAVLFVHVPTGLLTAGQDPLPRWDDTTEIFDYAPLEPALRAQGWLDNDTLIVANDWIDAGHLSTGLNGAYAVRVLGPEPHHFQFMRAATDDRPGLLLVPGRGAALDRARDTAARFAGEAGATLQPLGDVTLPRGPRPYLTVAAYRITW